MGSDILDSIFSLAILMMSIGSTKGESLVRLLNRFFEQFGVEESVIRMIMSNGHTMALGDSFERSFRFNSGFRIEFGH